MRHLLIAATTRCRSPPHTFWSTVRTGFEHRCYNRRLGACGASQTKTNRKKCSSRRASKNGGVFITVTESMKLLDWTGRRLMPGKRGAMPKNASPILDRLKLSAEFWLYTVDHFGKRRSSNRITPASGFNAMGKPP